MNEYQSGVNRIVKVHVNYILELNRLAAERLSKIFQQMLDDIKSTLSFIESILVSKSFQLFLHL
jgi:hypothetical protein